MNHSLTSHTNTFVLVYLDDILFFCNSLDDHIYHFDIALSLLASYSTRLRLQKCFVACNELEYLGHMVSKDSQRPSNNTIKAVSVWQCPKTVTETQRFLGFRNFYTRYIHRYSHMAAPLTIFAVRTFYFNGRHVNTAALKKPLLLSSFNKPTHGS
jgi:hypothetical protein